MRKIIHVDMDAFFASVEELDDPGLRGKAVIVSGSPEGRGVVSSASYEARRYGVHSAMPITRARKLCPQAVFVEARIERYAEVAQELLGIFKKYTPLVEPASLDEAYLDVTDTEAIFGGAENIGREIKRRIREEIGLTASIGIGPNKFLAKLASDLRKPDGFVVIKDEEKEEVLRDLPVSKILGVGRATENRLHELGIHTIGDLRALPLEALVEEFGRWGEGLYYLSRGVDESPVVTDWEPKSTGRSVTFERDIKDYGVIRRQLYQLTEEVTSTLRDMGLRAKTITIKIRYSNFKTITRSTTLDTPTDLTETIWRYVDALLRERVDLEDKAVRLVGVTLSNLTVAETLEQLHLFQDQEVKAQRLQEATDQIKEKLGEGSIKKGFLL
ncbi:MAG: DNA polymerase IV [Candidatus Brocadiales bacterium]|nr:DNA polymerase IV [Candidatus Brocadiales bacterium]